MAISTSKQINKFKPLREYLNRARNSRLNRGETLVDKEMKMMHPILRTEGPKL